MRVLDNGHNYELSSIDGDFKQTLRFVKRVGDNYPGNKTAYSGTTIQDVCRALIQRLEYVTAQRPCIESIIARQLLKQTLYILEVRAKRIKGKVLPDHVNLDGIEYYSTCKTCGHIFCEEHNENC